MKKNLTILSIVLVQLAAFTAQSGMGKAYIGKVRKDVQAALAGTAYAGNKDIENRIFTGAMGKTKSTYPGYIAAEIRKLPVPKAAAGAAAPARAEEDARRAAEEARARAAADARRAEEEARREEEARARAAADARRAEEARARAADARRAEEARRGVDEARRAEEARARARRAGGGGADTGAASASSGGRPRRAAGAASASSGGRPRRADGAARAGGAAETAEVRAARVALEAATTALTRAQADYDGFFLTGEPARLKRLVDEAKAAAAAERERLQISAAIKMRREVEVPKAADNARHQALPEGDVKSTRFEPLHRKLTLLLQGDGRVSEESNEGLGLERLADSAFHLTGTSLPDAETTTATDSSIRSLNTMDGYAFSVKMDAEREVAAALRTAATEEGIESDVKEISGLLNQIQHYFRVIRAQAQIGDRIATDLVGLNIRRKARRDELRTYGPVVAQRRLLGTAEGKVATAHHAYHQAVLRSNLSDTPDYMLHRLTRSASGAFDPVVIGAKSLVHILRLREIPELGVDQNIVFRWVAAATGSSEPRWTGVDKQVLIASTQRDRFLNTVGKKELRVGDEFLVPDSGLRLKKGLWMPNDLSDADDGSWRILH